jgi:hypothetical protein
MRGRVRKEKSIKKVDAPLRPLFCPSLFVLKGCDSRICRKVVVYNHPRKRAQALVFKGAGGGGGGGGKTPE